MAIKLKLDEKGNVVVVNGMPVYVHEDGKEVPMDVPAALAKIEELNAESSRHRHEKKEALKKLEQFEGLDPEMARKALEITKNLDAKKLIDAGEVEKVKESIGKAFEAQINEMRTSYDKQLTETKKAVEQKDSQIFNLMVTNRFSASKFVTDRLAIPADFAEARFGKAFRIEDGKVVAYDASGKKIYSRKTPGSIADFDEALEVLVEEYPDKDRILRGTGASGSGKDPAGSKNADGAFVLTREQAKDPQQYQRAKEAAAKAGQTVQIATS